MRSEEAFPNVTVQHPWCRLAPDARVLAFPVLVEDGRPVAVATVTDRIPSRFSGTLAELDSAVVDWDFIACDLGLALGKVAVFPAGATDVEEAVIPFNAGDRLRELATDGQAERYAHILDL
jgi:hypothetical protein